MDAFNDPTVETVAVMSSSQIGKTEILNNVVGFFIDQDPAPILTLLPTLDLAETWSKDRLSPMVRDTPTLAGKMADAKARDSGNTLLHKALVLDTPIPTPDGWKLMADLAVGDRVFDETGAICSVTGVSPVFRGRECYGVRFSDKSEIVADAEHLWPVEWWALVRRKQTRFAGLLTTAEIASRVRKAERHRYAIPVARPLALPTANLPVDPYVLGVWLGDGNSHNTTVASDRTDAEEMARHLAACGVVTKVDHRAGVASSIRIDPKSVNRATNARGQFICADTGLRATLKTMGLISRAGDGNSRKHIPATYLRASVEQRLSLLQGLMDTDGSIRPRGDYCVFSNSNPALAEGAGELLSSLGLKFERKTHASYAVVDGRRIPGRLAARLEFVAPPEMPIFRLSRKLDRQTARKPLTTKATRRRIVAVEKMPSAAVRCIAVDSPSRLYLAGRTMIPTHNSFAGGHITMAGANSPASLSSRPIRITLCDEVDRYPASAGTEGDPVKLAEKRTTTFWNRKKGRFSTPTEAGISRIEAAFDESDQRFFWVSCWNCAEPQILVWEQVKWTGDDPLTAAYQCEHCGFAWNDAQRGAAVSKGEWRASKPFTGTAGFSVWEGYSPWVRLAETVKGFLDSKDKPEEFKVWWNTALGRVWRGKTEAPDWNLIYQRREAFRLGSVPRAGLMLTGSCDVQRSPARLEVDIWAWGRELESWLVDHIVIDGTLSDPDVRAQLDAVLDRTWTHESGAEMGIARFAIDTGYDTNEVHAWARRRGYARVAPVRGVDGFNRASPVAGPTLVDFTTVGKKVRRGARLWTVSSAVFKTEFYRALQLDRPVDEDLAAGKGFPPRFVHLPAELDSEWVKQAVAEHLVTIKTKRGFPRLEWQKLRERNEALDNRVYARAAAWIAGIDRFAEKHWRQLERNLGLAAPADGPSADAVPGPAASEDAVETAAPAAPGGDAGAARRGRRRTISSPYMKR